MPWMNRIVPTRRQQTPPLPSRPTPRSNANVPSDVNSVYEGSAIAVSKTQPTPLALPLHAGFDRMHRERSRTPPPAQSPAYRTQFKFPLPPSRHKLAPPRDKHRRSFSLPANSLDEESGSTTPITTPVTRLLTTTHARQSSSVNPFSTPFDDEHRAMGDDAGASHARKMQPNPFDAIAF